MVFDTFRGYGFVHHRALNDPAEYRKTLDLARRHPARTHIFEGDLCWDMSAGRERLYFRHPSYVIDTLAPDILDREIAEGRVLTLEDARAAGEAGGYLVIELKVGRGDWKRALERALTFLETSVRGRYWIDGFSLRMLEHVKTINRSTSVTLHTELVAGGTAFVGAPEWPPLRLRGLDGLGAVDGIAIRRHGSEAFMAKACAAVHAAGKALVVSRLHTLRHFACSKAWGAKAGYMHWDFDELLAYNDALDTKTTGL